MQRNSIAIVIQPFKNALTASDKLKSALSVFTRNIIELAALFPTLRWNIVMPGYMLQHIDPLVLTELGEIQKRECLEWLTPGYTEPFLSFSPLWLSGANIRAGISAFEERLAIKPAGYAPPFSNWEPSAIDTIKSCGFQYALASKEIFGGETRNYCGYWITENMGVSMPVFPANMIHHSTAMANISDWIDGLTVKDPGDESLPRLVTINYLVPLIYTEAANPYHWLHATAKVIDSLLIKYSVIRLSEYLSLSYPRGLQYLPPQLVFKRDHESSAGYFSNYLHSFGQTGLLQRKMLEITDCLEPIKDTKDGAALIRQLFPAQDINRYLPARHYGFTHLYDRLSTYAKMIDIETTLHKMDKIKGGRIRIADNLRNGAKSITLTNSSIKACIDHKNGGQIFDLDFRERSINLFAGHSPGMHTPPQILVAGKSCTSFVDHFLDEKCMRAEFLERLNSANDEFSRAEFNYSIKKTTGGAKAVLSRNCAVSIEGKNYPLSLEKVFGLEGEASSLSFVYQLFNPSLASYRFRLAVEFTLTLPGMLTNEAQIICGDVCHKDLQTQEINLEQALKWSVQDDALGMNAQFILQKPVDVWILPARKMNPPDDRFQGITMVISTQVSMDENARWSLIGKMALKKLKNSYRFFDEI